METNRSKVKEACMSNLAAIRLEKKKCVEDLWNIEWRESKLIEKMKRHNFLQDEEDDSEILDNISSDDLR